MRPMTIDASILGYHEAHKNTRDDIKGGIDYTFPGGFNGVDVMAKCRVLNCLDDFDAVYAVTLLLLSGKEIVAARLNQDGVREELYRINAADWINLQGIQAIREYPVLLVWLIEAVAQRLVEEITDAWKKSVVATSEEKAEGSTDPFDTGTADGEGKLIVKRCFGDELLYTCYEFYDRFKRKPDSWLEIFDFLRFMKVKNIFRDIAMESAKAGEDNA
jgi:hypothetical protein